MVVCMRARFVTMRDVAECARELFAQLQACAQEPHFYIGFADFERCDSFPHGEFLHVP